MKTVRNPTDKYAVHSKSHDTKSNLEACYTQVSKLTGSAG